MAPARTVNWRSTSRNSPGPVIGGGFGGAPSDADLVRDQLHHRRDVLGSSSGHLRAHPPDRSRPGLAEPVVLAAVEPVAVRSLAVGPVRTGAGGLTDLRAGAGRHRDD